MRERERGRRTDTICETEGASGLDRTPNVLYPSRTLFESGVLVEFAKVLAREHFETRDDFFARQVPDRLDRSLLGHLDLEFALAEPELEFFRHEPVHVRFGDHVLTRDPEVNISLSDETRNVGRGEEHAVKTSRCVRYIRRVFSLEVFSPGGKKEGTDSAMLWLRTRQTSRRCERVNWMSAPGGKRKELID